MSAYSQQQTLFIDSPGNLIILLNNNQNDLSPPGITTRTAVTHQDLLRQYVKLESFVNYASPA
jgi:hypothetical protein